MMTPCGAVSDCNGKMGLARKDHLHLACMPNDRFWCISDWRNTKGPLIANKILIVFPSAEKNYFRAWNRPLSFEGSTKPAAVSGVQ